MLAIFQITASCLPCSPIDHQIHNWWSTPVMTYDKLTSFNSSQHCNRLLFSPIRTIQPSTHLPTKLSPLSSQHLTTSHLKSYSLRTTAPLTFQPNHPMAFERSYDDETKAQQAQTSFSSHLQRKRQTHLQMMLPII